jgi:hypothetical protein
MWGAAGADAGEEEEDRLLLDLAIISDDPDIRRARNVEESERETLSLFDRLDPQIVSHDAVD